MHYNFLFQQVAVADGSIIIMNPINISYILTNQMNQFKDNMCYLQTKYSENVMFQAQSLQHGWLRSLINQVTFSNSPVPYQARAKS